MSMMAMFRSVPPHLIDRIRSDKDMLSAVIYRAPVAPGSINIGAQIEGLFRGILSDEQVDQMRNDPQKLEEIRAMLEQSHREISEVSTPKKLAQVNALGLREPVEIGKAWHGLHFLLSGTVWEPTAPPGNAIMGGTVITQEIDYEPRFMEPGEVSVTAAALNHLTFDELRQRYDPLKMANAKLYGGRWDDPQELEWLLSAFITVRDCYVDVSTRSDALLLYVV